MLDIKTKIELIDAWEKNIEGYPHVPRKLQHKVTMDDIRMFIAEIKPEGGTLHFGEILHYRVKLKQELMLEKSLWKKVKENPLFMFILGILASIVAGLILYFFFRI